MLRILKSKTNSIQFSLFKLWNVSVRQNWNINIRVLREDNTRSLCYHNDKSFDDCKVQTSTQLNYR